VTVDTYDGDGNWLSKHDVYTSLDGSSPTTDDTVTVNAWNGERQLSTTTTVSFTGFSQSWIWTYKYQCDNARGVPAHLAASTLPPVVRPAPLRHPPGVRARADGLDRGWPAVASFVANWRLSSSPSDTAGPLSATKSTPATFIMPFDGA
jgi:hypothetical protein